MLIFLQAILHASKSLALYIFTNVSLAKSKSTGEHSSTSPEAITITVELTTIQTTHCSSEPSTGNFTVPSIVAQRSMRNSPGQKLETSINGMEGGEYTATPVTDLTILGDTINSSVDDVESNSGDPESLTGVPSAVRREDIDLQKQL